MKNYRTAKFLTVKFTIKIIFLQVESLSKGMWIINIFWQSGGFKGALKVVQLNYYRCDMFDATQSVSLTPMIIFCC